MAKITVCDVCKSEGKLTETRRFFSVRHHPELKIETCDVHNKEISKMSMLDYVKLAYKLSGREVSDKSITEMYGGKLKGIPKEV